MLINNMKKIYKSIDTSKVNDRNINQVMEQFNQWSIKETVKEIKITSGKKSKPSFTPGGQDDPQISQIKFQRDRSAASKSDVRYMERPQFTNDNLYKQKEQSRDNFNSRNLQEMFSNQRPNNNENDFNNYSFGMKDSDQTSKDLERLIMERNNQVPGSSGRTQRQEINFALDGGDSRNSGSRSIPKGGNMSYNPNVDINQNSNQNLNNSQPTVMEFNSSDVNYNSNQVLEHDLTDNLNSLDNYNTMITDINVTEDPAPFEDRLKRLQSDRNNMTTNFDTIPSQQDSNKSYQSNSSSQQQQKAREMQNQMEQLNIQRYQEQQMMQQQQQQQQQQQNDEYSEIQSVGSNNQNSNYDISGFYDVISKLNDQIQKLKEENFKLLQQKPNMDEYKSLDEAKQQIASEFTKLTEKHNIVESNMQILMQKEMEIMKKEEEMNQILNSYNNIFNTSIYQITIDTRFMDNNSESYRFNLEEPLDRVKSLELISYNVPINKYNITKFNNNIKYMIDNQEYEYNLEEGVYTIDTLIDELNKKCDRLEFEINFQEKTLIKSEENFDMTMTTLLYKVLGFDRKTSLVDNKEYLSDKVYDLRTETYINLNITNIESSKEFCTLNLVSHKSVKKLEFNQPKRIEHLDISFTTFDNNPISFNNRYHTLTFKLEALNEPLVIEGVEEKKNDINSDSS